MKNQLIRLVVAGFLSGLLLIGCTVDEKVDKSSLVDMDLTAKNYSYDVLKENVEDYVDSRKGWFKEGYRKSPMYQIVDMEDIMDMYERAGGKGRYLVLRNGFAPSGNVDTINTYLYLINENFEMVPDLGGKEGYLLPDNDTYRLKRINFQSGEESFYILDDLIRCPPYCPRELDFN
jgi:outer membrane murein-binding lipoprotein Lpp